MFRQHDLHVALVGFRRLEVCPVIEEVLPNLGASTQEALREGTEDRGYATKHRRNRLVLEQDQAGKHLRGYCPETEAHIVLKYRIVQNRKE